MKTREPTPEVYRVLYRIGHWKTKSTRFFTAFSAAEAFESFYQAFIHNHIDGDPITVYEIHRYDRFADRWEKELHLVGISEYGDDVSFYKKKFFRLTRKTC